MINDYATLQDAVARWLARTDLSLSIPDFIMLAETRINRDLRVRAQQSIVSGTTVSQQLTLPSDFRQMEAFIVTVAGIETALKPVPPDRSTNSVISPIPSGYWIGGNTLYLTCNTDYAYRMVYFSGVPSLSASNTQNWLIQQDASVYLYASLLEAAAYMQDDDRIPIWRSGYDTSMDSLRRQDDYARYSPAPRQRVDFVVS